MHRDHVHQAPGASIVVDGVRKRYAGEHTDALAGATLTVEPGELVALVGPSGSGKSTLLHLVAALDRPDAGTIRVGGFDVARHLGTGRYRREGVGLVFQLHNLLPHLTAEQNIEIAMLGTHLGRAERRERARALLERVGLADKCGEVPSRLSGGERQRVAVARAFANDPRVILADEPTGSLDDASTEAVVAMLRGHVDEGGTVLAVTHDSRLLSAVDRSVTLRAGRTA